jgi:hypothetical protein
LAHGPCAVQAAMRGARRAPGGSSEPPRRQ